MRTRGPNGPTHSAPQSACTVRNCGWWSCVGNTCFFCRRKRFASLVCGILILQRGINSRHPALAPCLCLVSRCHPPVYTVRANETSPFGTWRLTRHFNISSSGARWTHRCLGPQRCMRSALADLTVDVNSAPFLPLILFSAPKWLLGPKEQSCSKDTTAHDQRALPSRIL